MAHPHAENMRLYAEDAAETDRPWERWEVRSGPDDTWETMHGPVAFLPELEYRRKPRMVQITGPGGTFEYPEPMRESPLTGFMYYMPSLMTRDLAESDEWGGFATDFFRLTRGLVHQSCEAAEQHARALILSGGGEMQE